MRSEVTVPERGRDIKKFELRDDGRFPNHPSWPLLVYPAAVELPPGDPAQAVERLFGKNGWGDMWRDGIYPFHHYHSNNHEVLGVFRGTALVQFGGPSGPEIELRAGDVAVVPAGTAHRNLGSSADLGVVGAYPPGPSYDLCRGDREKRSKAMETIKQVPKPEADPVFGKSGGLRDEWPA